MKNWIALAFSAFLISCGGTPKTVEKSFIDENIDFARAQLGNEIEVIEASGKCLNPVTLKRIAQFIIAAMETGAVGSSPARCGICMN